MKQVFKQADFFENGGCISAGRYTEHKRENMHSHDFFELSYVYEGRGIHKTGSNRQQNVRENDFVIISPGAEHCMISPPEVSIKVCNLLICSDTAAAVAERIKQTDFCASSFARLISDAEPFCVVLRDNSGMMRALLDCAVYEYSNRRAASDTVLENTAVNLFIMAARIYESMQNGEYSDAYSSVTDVITGYVRANYGSSISLRQLAALVHLSPEYLSRLFKKCTGKRLYDFITETRIDKARYFLCSTNDTIDSIAIRCGYDSPACFRRAFRSINGMSASEYRKRGGCKA